MRGNVRLLIGDVGALTGITAGRIRHYEAQGLLAPGHLASGYRTFSPEDVLRLLHIDLLRSIGMGLEDIAASLHDQPSTLRNVLARHRSMLDTERRRLEVLVAAVDRALADSGDTESVIERLATTHRDSLGMFGRLTRPLSTEAAQFYERLFASWELPVPALYGQMLLPEAVSDLLEKLAAAPGHEILFADLRGLAERSMAATGDEDVDRLATEWVEAQLGSPPPTAVADALREAAPRLLALPVFRHGFRAWAESLTPLAARLLGAIEVEGERRGARVLGVILVPTAAGVYG